MAKTQIKIHLKDGSIKPTNILFLNSLGQALKQYVPTDQAEEFNKIIFQQLFYCLKEYDILNIKSIEFVDEISETE